ncbi:hypothetical protein BJ912DRAFT_979312, partial [Pholiota molesta]
MADLPITLAECTVNSEAEAPGCTCGLCTDQWLSPRMTFRLQSESEMTADGMGMDVDYFEAGNHSPPRRSLSRTPNIFRWRYAAYSQDSANGMPTPAPVLAQGLGGDARNVNFYINKGGRVEYALDAIIHAAKEQSVLGDGSFDKLWDNPDDTRDGGMVNMPKCANDLAFSL